MAELTESLVSVQELMNSVKLKLNPDKIEFIITRDKHTRESLMPNFFVKFLQIKSLGVTFESEETFDSHVGKVCCACHYHLRDL